MCFVKAVDGIVHKIDKLYAHKSNKFRCLKALRYFLFIN